VRERQAMSLEQASGADSDPADLFGIKGRGAPEDGFWPPIVAIFDPATVRLLQPRRTALPPARWRQAHGDAVRRHRYTVVNGEITYAKAS